MPKEKSRLSMSKPVLMARSKSEGGLQYSGTKIGSVNPKSEVHKLTTIISFLLVLSLSDENTSNQMPKRIRLQINQAYCIDINLVVFVAEFIVKPSNKPSANVGVDDGLN